MFDYFRIACAVPNVEVADVGFNVERAKEFILKAKNKNVDLLVFPELSLTSRSCADLFFQRSLLISALEGVNELISASRGSEIVLAVGAPARFGGDIYDCAVVIAKGKAAGIVPKVFSSNYGEIGGKKRFAPARNLKISSVPSSFLGIPGDEYEIPVGELVFDVGGVKTGFEIGDDAISPVPPSVSLRLAGAKVVANLAAVPETTGDVRRARSNAARTSENLRLAYALCSAGASESTTDFVFSGLGLICENGTFVAEQKKTAASDYAIIADVDLGKLERSETEIGERFAYRSEFYEFKEPRLIKTGAGPSESAGEYAKVEKFPFVPSDENEKREKILSVFETQAAGLKKRLQKTGSRPVLGVSGGLDSTLALLVCVKAAKDLGKPSNEVVGVTMPCFGTSKRTYRNAVGLMESLGITSEEIPIKEACLLHFRDIGQDPKLFDATYENAQARERTQVLMDLAGRIGGFVVGSGDLSEAALGWCTYNGDHASMYAVNSGVPKTLIPHILSLLAEDELFSASAKYINDVVNTPISPELLPLGADGETAQKTEDAVGPYALNDFFLYDVLRFGFEPEKIFFRAKKAFNGEFGDAEILDGLKNFYRRFFNSQFKRSCAPDGVCVCEVGLSPRGFWSAPSDASAEIWLKAAEKIKI